MRKLVGKAETITHAELEEIKVKQVDDILTMLLEAFEASGMDEEDRSTASVNIVGKIGNLMNICELQGLLEDDEMYIAKLPYNEGVKFEEDI